MSETQPRDPHKIPHVGDVFAAPYPRDCDERLRETVRVVETRMRDNAGNMVIDEVVYVRGALRTPRKRPLKEFREQVAGWDVRQLGA